MPATINSIRQRVMSTLKTRLLAINGGSTYSRDLEGERVYTFRDTPQSLPSPSVVIVQGEERILKQYSDRYECKLNVDIGFVDTGHFDDPSDEACQFLADIQLAMGTEFTITAPHFVSGEDVVQTVQLDEDSNALVVSDTSPSMLLGRVTYTVLYRRNIADPSKH